MKGGDALVYRALWAVDASITFHYIYTDSESGCEVDIVFEESSQVRKYDCLESTLQREYNGRDLDRLGVYTALEAPITRRMGWDEPTLATATKFEYLTYGNEPSIATEYASICMIASALGHNIQSKW